MTLLFNLSAVSRPRFPGIFHYNRGKKSTFLSRQINTDYDLKMSVKNIINKEKQRQLSVTCENKDILAIRKHG